jgi:hypothetical protein
MAKRAVDKIQVNPAEGRVRVTFLDGREPAIFSLLEFAYFAMKYLQRQTPIFSSRSLSDRVVMSERSYMPKVVNNDPLHRPFNNYEYFKMNPVD